MVNQDMFALPQHTFTKDCTSIAEKQDELVETLTQSIQIPGRVISMLHPWQDPIPLRRVWW